MENYEVLEHLGDGSFGRVYKARRKNTGFTVAMKFISKYGKSDKDIKTLRQEIAILKTLNHENIILMFDTFESEREFCVVTEYAQGELFDILQDDKRLPEATVQKIAKGLVKALHYLHSKRIIHRDMKPQNVLIASNGRVKLCDFGFARAMSSNTIVLTSIKGTPLYMSPELVQEQPYDVTSDLWSLGVILYELYCGQPPFYTNSIYTLINQIVKESVKYPTDISKEFKSFLQGLLQKNPKKRLTWPALLDHPFVRESEQDKITQKLENTFYSQSGGVGGPRERLEKMMNMSSTMTPRSGYGNSGGGFSRHDPLINNNSAYTEDDTSSGGGRLPHAEAMRKQYEEECQERENQLRQIDEYKYILQQIQLQTTMKKNTHSGGDTQGKEEEREEREEQVNDMYGIHSHNRSDIMSSLNHTNDNDQSSIVDPSYESPSITNKKSTVQESLETKTHNSATPINNNNINRSQNAMAEVTSDKMNKSLKKMTPLMTRTNAEKITLDNEEEERENDLLDKNPHITDREINAVKKTLMSQYQYWHDISAIIQGNTDITFSSILHTKIDCPSMMLECDTLHTIFININDITELQRLCFSVNTSSTSTSHTSIVNIINIIQTVVDICTTLIQKAYEIFHEERTFSEVSLCQQALQMFLCMGSTLPSFIHMTTHLMTHLQTFYKNSTSDSATDTHLLLDMETLAITSNVLITYLLMIPVEEDMNQLSLCQHIVENLCQVYEKNPSYIRFTFGLTLSNRWSAMTYISQLLSSITSNTNITSRTNGSNSNDLHVQIILKIFPVIELIVYYGSHETINLVLTTQIPSYLCDLFISIMSQQTSINTTVASNSVMEKDSLIKGVIGVLSKLCVSTGMNWKNATPLLHYSNTNQKEKMTTVTSPTVPEILSTTSSSLQYDDTIINTRRSYHDKVIEIITYKLFDTESIHLYIQYIQSSLRYVTDKNYESITHISNMIAILQCILQYHTNTTRIAVITSMFDIIPYNELLSSLHIYFKFLMDEIHMTIHNTQTNMMNDSLISHNIEAMVTMVDTWTNLFLYGYKRMTPTIQNLVEDIIHSVYLIDKATSSLMTVCKPVMWSAVCRFIHSILIHTCTSDDISINFSELQLYIMTLITSNSAYLHQLINIITMGVTTDANTLNHISSFQFIGNKILKSSSNYSVHSHYGYSYGIQTKSIYDDMMICLMILYQQNDSCISIDTLLELFKAISDNFSNNETLSCLSLYGYSAYLHLHVLYMKSLLLLSGTRSLRENDDVSRKHIHILQYLSQYTVVDTVCKWMHSKALEKHIQWLHLTSSSSSLSRAWYMDTCTWMTADPEYHSNIPLSLHYNSYVPTTNPDNTSSSSSSSSSSKSTSAFVSPKTTPRDTTTTTTTTTTIHDDNTTSADDSNRIKSLWISYTLQSVITIINQIVVSISFLPPNAKDNSLFLEELYRKQIIPHILYLVRSHSSSISLIQATTISNIMLELVLRSTKFTSQFLENDGLNLLNQLSSTHKSSSYKQDNTRKYHYEIIINVLQISAHLARNSAEHYPLLASIYPAQLLAEYILHTQPSIRSKCCNFIGNLCRHTDYFYKILNQRIQMTKDMSTIRVQIYDTHHSYQHLMKKDAITVATLLCEACGDLDPTTRKFACFAVGNSGFHNNQLYAQIVISIPFLQLALEDEDEKTRANSAGALGNLVRNGSELTSWINEYKIPYHLMKMALIDSDPAAQRNAIFSLGAIAIYKSCREKIYEVTNPSIQELMTILLDTVKNDNTIKFIERLKKKLEQPPIAG